MFAHFCIHPMYFCFFGLFVDAIDPLSIEKKKDHSVEILTVSNLKKLPERRINKKQKQSKNFNILVF